MKRLFNNIISLFFFYPPLWIYLLYLTNRSIYMGREIDRKKKENLSVSHSESKRTVKCDSNCMQGAVLWTLVTPGGSLPWGGVKWWRVPVTEQPSLLLAATRLSVCPCRCAWMWVPGPAHGVITSTKRVQSEIYRHSILINDYSTISN